ncbi:MAG: phosphatase PAP2 family protein [Ignavibacteria bacterium]
MRFLKFRIFITILSISLLSQFGTAQEVIFHKSPTDTFNIDESFFLKINSSRSKILDFIVPTLDKTVLPVAITLPIASFAISRASSNSYNENSAVLLGLSEFTSATITFTLKNIVKRHRPFVKFPNSYYNKNNSPTDEFSFPSGHSSIAFSIATLLTLRYPDKPLLIVTSYLYATTIAYGRVYLGVHYPSDVLVGALIGSVSSALIYSLRKEIITTKNSVFNENEKFTETQGSIKAGYFLFALVSTDVLNYFVYKNKIKLLRRTTFSLSSVYPETLLNLNISF